MEENKSSQVTDFESVKSYEDILNVNILFLQGKLNKTPYHGGPVDEETIPLLGPLIKLNERGFFTICSQPALIREPEFIKKTWYVGGEKCGNWWVKTRQKPFVEGYLPREQYASFRDFIRKEKDYYYELYGFTRTERKRFFLKPKLEVTTIAIENNFPKNYTRYSVTQSVVGDTEEECKSSNNWESYTSLPINMNDYYDFSPSSQLSNVLLPNCFKVIVCGKKWGEGSTIDLFLKFYGIQEIQ